VVKLVLTPLFLLDLLSLEEAKYPFRQTPAVLVFFVLRSASTPLLVLFAVLSGFKCFARVSIYLKRKNRAIIFLPNQCISEPMLLLPIHHHSQTHLFLFFFLGVLVFHFNEA
jgi:hypothetical protein